MVAAIDRSEVGRDAGSVAGIGVFGLSICDDLEDSLELAEPTVLVDFTVPSSAMGNIETALRAKVAAVVGTTGLTPDDLSQIRAWSLEFKTPCLVAPNFAIGAVLMMRVVHCLGV